MNPLLSLTGKFGAKGGAKFVDLNSVHVWETDFYPVRVLGGVVLAL